MTRFLRPIPAAIFVGAGQWQDVRVTAIGPGEKVGTMRVETVDHGPWNVDAKGLRCDHEAARAAAAEALSAKIEAKVSGILGSIISDTVRLVRERLPDMEPEQRTRAAAMVRAVERLGKRGDE